MPGPGVDPGSEESQVKAAPNMCGEARGHFGALSQPLGELMFAQAYLVINVQLDGQEAV